MPSRQQKLEKCNQWRILFASSTANSRCAASTLANTCKPPSNFVCLRSDESTVVVHNERAVSYDAVVRFVVRKCNLPKCHFSVHVHDSDVSAVPGTVELPAVAASAALRSPTAAATAVESPASALRAVAASAAPAESTVAASAIPLRNAAFLQMKLLQQSPELPTRGMPHHPPPIDRDYAIDFGLRLGGGTYGDVYAARHRTCHAKVAVKFTRTLEAAMHEVAAHAALPHHACVCALLDAGVTPRGHCLVTPLFDMDLHTFINRSGPTVAASAAQIPLRNALEPEVGQYVLRCMGAAVCHIHAHGIIHNDLKPANVLICHAPAQCTTTNDHELAIRLSQLRNMRVCVGDLGCALPGDPQDRFTMAAAEVERIGVEAGTLPYRAPEILLGCAAHDFKGDVWAWGCVAVELFCGKRAFGCFADAVVRSSVEATLAVFQQLGKPANGMLTSLPLFPKKAQTSRRCHGRPVIGTCATRA